jgi:hypothetical protein
MTKEEAEKMICPFTGSGCTADKCMAWVITANGKKEVDRYKIPYDTYPSDAGWIHRSKIADGYEEVARETYVKYEEAYEGYCSLINRGEI